MSQILVVGSLAYDSVQTPYGKVDRALGGSANYFSLSASLFAPVRVVGVVGKDYDSKDLDLLRSRSVDTTGLQICDGKTFHWAGSYEGDMNEATTHATELNVFESFDPRLPESYVDSEFVFLANIHPALQMKVLSQVRKPLFTGMDTMNFWITGARADLDQVLKKVDVILINEKESMMLTSSPNAVAAAGRVLELGPKAVVIKRGEYGFLMCTREGFFILPAYPTPTVIDPTGAGDSFAGGFFGYLAGLKKTPGLQDLKEACIHGTTMASFTIQDFSVRALQKVDSASFAQRMKAYRAVVSS